MPINRFFLSDFVSIQRQSFFELLETGLIEEFSKRNPITNQKKDFSLFFYPNYYILTRPEYTPQEAILKNKSYTSKLYVPAQLTDKKQKIISLKWVYIGNIPLMTKRGHFILNGAARVIVNQILRSPGVYYQQKIYENTCSLLESETATTQDTVIPYISTFKKGITKKRTMSDATILAGKQPENRNQQSVTSKIGELGGWTTESNAQNEVSSEELQDESVPPKGGTKLDYYKRYYTDLICMRGTWLRIEMDKEKNIWAQMKKGPKIPIFWFLLAMGLSEKIIFKSILDSHRLIGNLESSKVKESHYNDNNDISLAAVEDSSLEFSVRGRHPRKKKSKEGEKKKITSRTLGQSSSPTGSCPSKEAALPSTEKRVRKKNKKYPYLKNPPEAWQAIYALISKSKTFSIACGGEQNSTIKKKEKNLDSNAPLLTANSNQQSVRLETGGAGKLMSDAYLAPHSGARYAKPGLRQTSPEQDSERKRLEDGPLFEKVQHSRTANNNSARFLHLADTKGGKNLERESNSSSLDQRSRPKLDIQKKQRNFLKSQHISSKPVREDKTLGEIAGQARLRELGRKWLYNRFMNPRSYNLGKQGRLAFNRKLGLKISLKQLTLTGLDVLYATDFLIKVEKGIYKTDDIDHLKNRRVRTSGELIQIQIGVGLVRLEKSIRDALNQTAHSPMRKNKSQFQKQIKLPTSFSAQSFINNKAFNSAMREFFGTSQLSQFMDQINPLAELTHKRRLSSMGPGGVTRDSATLAIRGIHPTHYGRICPIETPEGKNTGLVNSMTTYARVNQNGIIESPFYKVYKGQVQKNTGMYYFSAEQEEQIKLAAADLSISSVNFLPKSLIPVRIAEEFTKIFRTKVQFIGVSPLQMISIAASLIPFLEHDDANRALMGSNMQRQAVPLIRPERPIVGTGLEARAVSDSGHALQSKYSGLVTYVSAKKIVVYSLVACNQATV